MLSRRYFRGKQELVPVGGGMTLDNGEFRVADLAPGRYWISAAYRGSMMFSEAPARNPDGKPEEAYVTTYYPNSADQAGAGAIDLEAGQELPGIDIRMRKAVVYRIRGKVVGPPSARNVRLIVTPRDAMFFGFGGMGAGVKEDGSFELANIQPGSYYISAMMPMQGMMRSLGRVAVDVVQGNVEGVTLVLGGSTLNGSIRIDGDVQSLERKLGKKVTFESVRVQPAPFTAFPFGGMPASVKEDGSFTIENLPPVKYRLMVVGIPPGTYIQSIRAGDSDALNSAVEITSGAPVKVQVVLGVGVGEVIGVVQDAKGQPVAGATVTLLPDPLKEEPSGLTRTASSDQNGQFFLSNAAPGDYKLFAWQDVEPLASLYRPRVPQDPRGAGSEGVDQSRRPAAGHARRRCAIDPVTRIAIRFSFQGDSSLCEMLTRVAAP